MSTLTVTAAAAGSVLMVPPLDDPPWPSLGAQVCERVEAKLVHGPGDLRGQRMRLDDEKRGLLYRAYEVYPRDHAMAGRRRFKRVGLSLRKGSAKTEFAAAIAAVELDPEGPVRTVEWRDAIIDGALAWEPIGGPVTDPFIPLLAYTEEQSEELCYYALYVMLQNSPLAHLFDLGLERIMRVAGDGTAKPIATAPNAADGARTTFQVFDETHRYTLDRHRKAHQTMLRNIPKRKLADAWSLEITTAFSPGENSVAESTMDYAKAVAEGRVADSRLFFFHRQASDDGHDLTTPEGVRAAVLEASGPGMAGWSDVPSIVGQFFEPDADLTYLERTWLNRPKRSADKAFDSVRWGELAAVGYVVQPRARIALGFDGSRTKDATALIGTELLTGYQWPVGIWERPHDAPPDWEVDELEVNAAVRRAFNTWRVVRFYCDPPYWETTVALWAQEFGKEVVLYWYTRLYVKAALAARAYKNAMTDGSLKHSGDPVFARHVANAHKRPITQKDEKDQPLFVLQKERPDSPLKIDAAQAGVLSWEAYRDALTLGEGKTGRSKYEDEDPRVLDVDELQDAEDRAKARELERAGEGTEA